MDSTVAAGRREGCIHSKIFGAFHTGGMHGIQKCLIALLVDGFTQIADGAMAQLMQIIHTGPGGIIAAAQNLIHGEFPLLQSIGLSLADIESVNMDNSNALTGFSGGTGDVLGCWNAIALSAEDAGHVRISDSGKQGYPAPCGTFATKQIMEENFDLVATAVAVFHLAVEWCYESEENMAQAAQWYLDHCDEEGFLCNEDVAKRTMEWYAGPTVDEFINIFTETAPDAAGKYTARELLKAERDILVGLDFFITEGKYTDADRTRYLDECRIDPSVALAVKEMLGK